LNLRLQKQQQALLLLAQQEEAVVDPGDPIILEHSLKQELRQKQGKRLERAIQITETMMKK